MDEEQDDIDSALYEQQLLERRRREEEDERYSERIKSWVVDLQRTKACQKYLK